MKRIALLSLMMGVLSTGAAFAYSEDHDVYTLELKGYSAETIRPVEIMINRMEGRYPEPAPSKGTQFLRNLLNNEWSNNLQPFSQDSIDPPRDYDAPAPLRRD